MSTTAFRARMGVTILSLLTGGVGLLGVTVAASLFVDTLFVELDFLPNVGTPASTQCWADDEN